MTTLWLKPIITIVVVPVAGTDQVVTILIATICWLATGHVSSTGVASATPHCLNPVNLTTNSQYQEQNTN